MPFDRHDPQLPGRLCAAALLLCACASVAQTQDTRSQREREALRRSQATLQQTRAELEALRTEKAAALKEKEGALATAEELQARLDAARKEAATLRAELARLQTQHAAALKSQADLRAEEAATGQRRQQELQRDVAEQRQGREEMVRLNQNLVALLEQRTAEVAELRKRNAALHALGHEAIERYRLKSAMDMAMQDDPLFGLSKVRTENTAEDLRMRIDAQRSAPR